MILTKKDIEEIITTRPHKADVEFAQNMRQELFAHVFGVGLDRLLLQINNFENADQYAARKKYARSNKDLMERLKRPVDKVFSATGGSTYYNLPSNKDREFRNRIRNTENGLSLRKWIEQFWLPAYLSDPMGLIFMEVDQHGDAYPTYKGSIDVFDYQLNGRNLEYVVFSLPKDASRKDDNGKRFRVVDDAYDYIVEYGSKDGDAQVKIIGNLTFRNHFGEVPAFIVSDLPVVGTEYFESPFQVIVDLANEYLRECSVKSVYKLLHGFPKYWEYQSECPVCKGTRSIEGEVCQACKGTGSKLKWDVSDAKLLPVPESTTDVKIAPDVAGYVAPPIEAWGMMSEELKALEAIMYDTLWGAQKVDEVENNTATGKWIDTQPINDRLSKFSDAAESAEKFVTDKMGSFYYDSSYKGSSISYGRRYQIESPDTIWEKYQSARSKGAPDAILDDMLREYLQTKYKGDSLELQKQLRLLGIEPFPHMTAEQVQRLDVGEVDFLKKIYFSDFAKTLTENEIIISTVQTLEAKFNEYIKSKQDEKTKSNQSDPTRTGEGQGEGGDR